VSLFTELESRLTEPLPSSDLSSIMPEYNIIAIGASAGGLEPLRQLVAGLPSGFAAAVFIVWHVSPTHPSLLPQILQFDGKLPVAHAQNGEIIQSGRIYVAPPDYHLLVEDGCVRLYHGPKENHSRPAIDPLFRTAAEVYGERVIGVVLTGMLFDGTAGLIAIKRHGGIAIVQDPAEAKYPSMPRSAIGHDHPDYVLPIAQIAEELRRLVQGEAHASAK
jgi:two-component system, chemotaxis family, protein-glutamate methylesterase/glutaminase